MTIRGLELVARGDEYRSRIARRYDRLDVLGRGATGTVYRAYDRLHRRLVALKSSLLEIEPAGDEPLSSQPIRSGGLLPREFVLLAGLRHPNVVACMDYGLDASERPFFTMDLQRDALPLREFARDLSHGAKVDLLVQLLHALAYVHRRGLVHRDVKPDNVLLVKDPDAVGASSPLVAKLIDFGVVKMLPTSESDTDENAAMPTGMGVVVGTPNFMAPEQLRGGVQPDAAADLWALAACAFTAITGRIPFEGSTLSEVLYRVCESQPPVPSSKNANVPPEFDAWFARACDPDPERRFRTARDLATSLAHAYADYADACIDLTPSLTRFVAHRAIPSGTARTTPTARAAASARTSPTTRRLFDLDEPLCATSA